MTTTTQAHDGFARMVLDIERRTFLECHSALDGEHVPAHAVVLGASGETTYVHVGMCMTQEDGEKDLAALAIADVARKAGATALSFVSESWLLKNWPAGKPRPADFSTVPEAVEVLIVTIEEWGKPGRLFAAPIERRDGKRHLGEWVESTLGFGRFTGLLRPPEAQA
jgi:hypothetical protein